MNDKHKHGPHAGSGRIQNKIMLLLLAGVSLGLSRSHSRNKRTIKEFIGEWDKLGYTNYKRSARGSIQTLFSGKLVEEIRQPDGSFQLRLTKEGVQHARRQVALNGTIECKKPLRWDKLWRIVVFDIPETDRAFRDVLRNHLQTLEFYKLQQSVFISPHPYEKALIELIHLYNADSFVRVMTITKINQEEELKKVFFKEDTV